MSDIREAVENYRPSADDRRLIEEFKRNPIGHHSPDLQRLLNRMRGATWATATTVGSITIIAIVAGAYWLGLASGGLI